MGTPQFISGMKQQYPNVSSFELALKPTDDHDANMKNDFSHDIQMKVGNQGRNASRKSSFTMNF